MDEQSASLIVSLLMEQRQEARNDIYLTYNTP